MPGTIAYVPAIDGLRAVAIMLVMAAHFLAWPGGAIGVDIFFVISGYLITAILLREAARTGHIDIKAFYVRRFLRIVPALIFLLLSLFAAITLVAPHQQQYLALFYAASYVMNWAIVLGFSGGFVGHTWSLAVEEQFYVLWPLLLTAIVIARPRRQIIIVCSLIVLTTLWRAGLLATRGIDEWVLYGSDARANQILVGCLLAFLPIGPLSDWAAKTWPIAIAAIAGRVILGGPERADSIDSLVVAVGAGWLIAAVQGPRDTLLAKVLSAGACVGIGRLSYSLYLWHLPIMTALGWHRIVSPRLLPVAGLALSFAAATFSYHVVETPFLRMKDAPRRRELAAAGSNPATGDAGRVRQAVGD